MFCFSPPSENRGLGGGQDRGGHGRVQLGGQPVPKEHPGCAGSHGVRRRKRGRGGAGGAAGEERGAGVQGLCRQAEEQRRERGHVDAVQRGRQESSQPVKQPTDVFTS